MEQFINLIRQASLVFPPPAGGGRPNLTLNNDGILQLGVIYDGKWYSFTLDGDDDLVQPELWLSRYKKEIDDDL
jgi:hypothetical protein